MLHIYTYGRDSKQFVVLSAKQADLVNRFTDAFFKAQETFLQDNGRRWTPSDPINFGLGPTFSGEDLDAYNELTDRLYEQHKMRNKIFKALRIDVKNEDVGDYLVKRI